MKKTIFFILMTSFIYIPAKTQWLLEVGTGYGITLKKYNYNISTQTETDFFHETITYYESTPSGFIKHEAKDSTKIDCFDEPFISFKITKKGKYLFFSNSFFYQSHSRILREKQENIDYNEYSSRYEYYGYQKTFSNFKIFSNAWNIGTVIKTKFCNVMPYAGIRFYLIKYTVNSTYRTYTNYSYNNIKVSSYYIYPSAGMEFTKNINERIKFHADFTLLRYDNLETATKEYFMTDQHHYKGFLFFMREGEESYTFIDDKGTFYQGSESSSNFIINYINYGKLALGFELGITYTLGKKKEN